MGEMTAEDYESIDCALRELHPRGWRKALTLNEMLEAWASLVAEVERGYDQMVYEYTNDMACRGCGLFCGCSKRPGDAAGFAQGAGGVVFASGVVAG